MLEPEVAKPQRRTWREIADYYRPTPWKGLHMLALAAQEREDCLSLVTVGDHGCVMVFKGEECLAMRGYILLAWDADDDHVVLMGYFREINYDPENFVRLESWESAMQCFEYLLIKNEFLPKETK